MTNFHVSGILFEGISLHDGAPIAAIVTDDSANPKTGLPTVGGNMLQVWIIRTDLDPNTARKTGQDGSVCGTCPLQGDKGGCYVSTWQAPSAVYKAYKAGNYKRIEPEAMAGRPIRWGAYGDPALIPFDIASRGNAVASRWTGYTHMHSQPYAWLFRGTFMASAETPKQEAKLAAQGWSTFRAGRSDGSDLGTATACRNDRDGALCIDCGECNGQGQKRIVVRAHGTFAKNTTAERMAKRSLAVLS
jgi:hypothetical protein